MDGAGAAAAVAAAAPADGLAASYAAVQCTLRRQFFGDLVELRGALVNTLNLEPQRADNLHLKLQLIDGALRMLEETKAEVTSADMASLMNMSAKVVRAVEAWRARRASGQQGSAAAGVQPATLHAVHVQCASQQPPPQQPQQQSASQQQQSASEPQQSASQQQQSASHPQQQQQQQQQQQSAEAPQHPPRVLAVSVDADGDLRSRITSPFAAPEVQLSAQNPAGDAPTPVLQPPPPKAAAADAPAGGAAARGDGGDCTENPLSSVDQFDFLSKLVVDPVDPLDARTASLLPNIDWEVPEVKPSGNLDSLLPSEASQVLRAQQRTVEQKRAAARSQRMSSAEAFLARVSANAAEQSFAAEEPGTSGTLVGPARMQELAQLPLYQQSQRGALPPGRPCGPASQPPTKQQKQHHPQQQGNRDMPRDQLAAAAAHCPLASPRSAATSEPLAGPPPEVSCHSGGGSRLSGAAGCATAVGSAGYPATGSTEPSPTGSYHQLPTSQGAQPSHKAVQLGGDYATAGLQPSPFSSAAAQGAGARPAGQGSCPPSVSPAAFGSTQLVHPDAGCAAAQLPQQAPWLGSASRCAPAAALPPPPLGQTASAGGASLGFGGGNAHSSLHLSASGGRPGISHSSNPSIVGELQLLGLSSGSGQLGSQALPPHLQSMASYSRQTAAAAQLVAADHQQAERLSALRLLQQFPHAALHGGCGALQQLLSAGDSFGAPGCLNADPAGQLQHAAALQAQQQAAQLAQLAALDRYRRDQLQFQQLQQQLMQPFGGFPQPQPQAPAYQQAQLAPGFGIGPAGSGIPVGYMALPGHSAGAGMPGPAAAANAQSYRVCPSLAAGRGEAAWQAPNGAFVADIHAGHISHMQASGQHASQATYGSGAGGGFGESASLASGSSSRQKRRRA